LVKQDGSIVKCEGSHSIDKMYQIRYHSNDGTNKVKYSDNMSYGETILESNTFENAGIFEGWAVKPNGEVKYADKDKITVVPEDTKLETVSGEATNVLDLYAVWRKEMILVSFDIIYGSEYAAPHKTLKQKQLIPNCVSVEKSASVEVVAKPVEPADRYVGTVSCTNGVAASITHGSQVTENGFITRSDTVKVTNNSNGQKDSVCTIKYTPKWQGISYGEYTESDGIIKYGGLEWTFKKDWGDNVGIIQGIEDYYAVEKYLIEFKVIDEIEIKEGITFNDYNNKIKGEYLFLAITEEEVREKLFDMLNKTFPNIPKDVINVKGDVGNQIKLDLNERDEYDNTYPRLFYIKNSKVVKSSEVFDENSFLNFKNELNG